MKHETQSYLIYNLGFSRMYSNKQRLRSINMPNERANAKSKGDFFIRRELFTSKVLGFFTTLFTSINSRV